LESLRIVSQEAAVQVSFTRLDTYRRCPFQYKLRYQHHLPGQPRPGTRLALALHAALESFYRDLPTMPWPEQLLALFDAQWPAELSERDARAIEEGHTLLVDYFRRQDDTWPKVRFVEQSFRVQLGRYLLVGTLDRVDELPDGTLQIVDYKTARTPPQIPDTLQLDFYQVGLAAKTGEVGSRIVFEYLRHGSQHVVEVDDRNLPRTLERVQAVVAAVEADDTLAPRVGEHCRRCDYGAYCPAQQRHPLPVPLAAPAGQLALGL
jgi:putative RecB family exonuclease